MEITPRPFGEVLSDAINVLGRIWRPLLSSSLLAFIPVGILAVLVFRVSGAAEILDIMTQAPSSLDAVSGEQLSALVAPFMWASGLTVLFQGVATIFVYLVSHRAVAAQLSGETPSGDEIRDWALSRMRIGLPAGISAFVIAVVFIMAGVFALFVPFLGMAGLADPDSLGPLIIVLMLLGGLGVWLGVSFSMVTAVAALEDRGVLGTLMRSIKLVRRRWWPTLGYLLLVGLFGSIAIQLVQVVALPLAAVTDPRTTALLVAATGIVAQGVIVAALGAMYTLWYVDLRARKEPLLSGDLL
jgi:hypothetical protein